MKETEQIILGNFLNGKGISKEDFKLIKPELDKLGFKDGSKKIPLLGRIDLTDWKGKS